MLIGCFLPAPTVGGCGAGDRGALSRDQSGGTDVKIIEYAPESFHVHAPAVWVGVVGVESESMMAAYSCCCLLFKNEATRCGLSFVRRILIQPLQYSVPRAQLYHQTHCLPLSFHSRTHPRIRNVANMTTNSGRVTIDSPPDTAFLEAPPPPPPSIPATARKVHHPMISRVRSRRLCRAPKPLVASWPSARAAPI